MHYLCRYNETLVYFVISNPKKELPIGINISFGGPMFKVIAEVEIR